MDQTSKIVADLLKTYGTLTTPELVLLAKRTRSTVSSALKRLLTARIVRKAHRVPLRGPGRPRIAYELIPRKGAEE